jgi:hypothetical protein
MSAFFSSGHAVDIVLLVLALEVLALSLRPRGHLADVLTPVLPGMFLLFALRAALTGAGWIWVCLWITLSLPAHLADLWRRLR